MYSSFHKNPAGDGLESFWVTEHTELWEEWGSWGSWKLQPSPQDFSDTTLPPGCLSYNVFSLSYNKLTI